MNRQPRCAVVGHSQADELPLVEIAQQGHPLMQTPMEYRIFSQPGGTIDWFHSDLDIRRQLQSFDPDFIVLFLGANDIDAEHYTRASPFVIKDNLKNLGMHLKAQSQGRRARVFYLTIEKRHVCRSVTPDEYRTRRNKVNKTLTRAREMRLIFNDMRDDQFTDGVHFNDAYYRGLAWKIRHRVEEYAARSGW